MFITIKGTSVKGRSVRIGAKTASGSPRLGVPRAHTGRSCKAAVKSHSHLEPGRGVLPEDSGHCNAGLQKANTGWAVCVEVTPATARTVITVIKAAHTP